MKVLIIPRNICFSLAVALVIGAIVFHQSWSNDNTSLQDIAAAVTWKDDCDSDRIIRLNEWIDNIRPNQKRPRFFLSQSLGPSPLQVLKNGGDCAEKSRLLSAMLKQIDIPSTLAMLYPCEDCPSEHTVVEAKYENGWMAVDPVYNLFFPKPDGGFYGIEDLGKNHKLVVDRIRELKKMRGATDKINNYDVDEANYMYAKTINWNKSVLSCAFGFLVANVSDKPFLVRRPHFLEDPKLFIVLTCLIAAVTSFACSSLLWYLNRTRMHDAGGVLCDLITLQKKLK